jgi:hypothetical protein
MRMDRPEEWEPGRGPGLPSEDDNAGGDLPPPRPLPGPAIPPEWPDDSGIDEGGGAVPPEDEGHEPLGGGGIPPDDQ